MLNFGEVGTTDTFVDVVEPLIVNTTLVSPFMMATATAEHNADEHALVPIKLSATVPTTGVGFRIMAHSENGSLTGTFNVQWIGA